MGNSVSSLRDFFYAQGTQVNLGDFAVNLIIAFALSYILSVFYVRFSKALSNRRLFADNFVIIAMTTTLLITVVKSSLALSLGLVGALSITRFRTAIKDPEELAFLFLAIGVGVGLGAGQRGITLIGFALLILAILARNLMNLRRGRPHNLFLTVAGEDASGTLMERVVNTLKETCASVTLKRMDESRGRIEASFLVELEKFADLSHTQQELKKLDSTMEITFLDNKGLV